MIFKTLLSHYRTHPVQALFLVTGIAIANVLLVGTLLINAQARASYGREAADERSTPIAFIAAANGARHIDEIDYFSLRRQGFDQLAPVMYWFVRSAPEGGPSLELTGIDIFAMPRGGSGSKRTSASGYDATEASSTSGPPGVTEFISPPFQLLGSPSRLSQLGLSEGEVLELPSGQSLPPVAATNSLGLGHRMLIDIGALQAISGQPGLLSGIIVFGDGSRSLEELERVLPAHLELVNDTATADPVELTSSFHLNLAAMGFLAFIVGVFLTFNAISFSYTDRQELIRKLKLCGVSRRQLTAALIAELLLFALIGLTLGYVLGVHLALWLIPGVGQTLAQLYGVYIAYPGYFGNLAGSGVVIPVVMTLLACALCAWFPMRATLVAPAVRNQAADWQMQANRSRDRFLLGAGLVLVTLCFLLALNAQSLDVALACMACLLLGAAMCLPAGIRFMLGFISRRVPPHRAQLQWLIADSRWLLGPVSLALMAMTLALVSNSGLNTMINSFRQATDDWLQQRLVAQLYLNTNRHLGNVQDWLDTHAPGAQFVDRFQRSITVQTPNRKFAELEVTSLPDASAFRDSLVFISSVPEAVELVESGRGVYLSERAAIIDHWAHGDLIGVCPTGPSFQVAGFYRNYGNPHTQGIISESRFRACWPGQPVSGHAITGPESYDWQEIRDRLASDFGLQGRQLVNPEEIRSIGLSVFDRTFSVTHALDMLTLLVAGIGIFCSVSAIHHHRRRQQALLACLGVRASERALLLLTQWGLLGVLCTLVVWPFGAALAWILSHVVTPVAFGWSFPVQLHWQHYPRLLLLACACLMLAGLLPALPGELLKESTA
jgi:putative ABC transport system permease protein